MPIEPDTSGEAASVSSGTIRRLPPRAALCVAAALPRARVPATSRTTVLLLLLLCFGASPAHIDRVLAPTARRVQRATPPEQARTAVPTSARWAGRRASIHGPLPGGPRARHRAPYRTAAVAKSTEPRGAAIGDCAQLRGLLPTRAEGAATVPARSGGTRALSRLSHLELRGGREVTENSVQ